MTFIAPRVGSSTLRPPESRWQDDEDLALQLRGYWPENRPENWERRQVDRMVAHMRQGVEWATTLAAASRS